MTNVDRPAVAKKYVSHLASFYRYLTETVNQDVMLLEEELNFIRDYIFLIKVRYGEDYLFDVRVEQPTDNRFLPSGALQNALENVVKHNAIDGNQIMTTLVVAEETVTISNIKPRAIFAEFTAKTARPSASQKRSAACNNNLIRSIFSGSIGACSSGLNT